MGMWCGSRPSAIRSWTRFLTASSFMLGARRKARSTSRWRRSSWCRCSRNTGVRCWCRRGRRFLLATGDRSFALPVQPDLLVEDFPLGVVDVVLHPRLGDFIERRAGDRVPVELVGHELLEFLGDDLAPRGVHLPSVAGVVVVDFSVGVARG